jgi:hypothetical protein
MEVMKRSLLRGTLVPFLLAGCGGAALAPSQNVPAFSTSDSVYVLDSLPGEVRVQIPYRLVNVTSGLLYVPRCISDPIGPRIERKTPSGWVLAYEQIYACVGAPPRVLHSTGTLEGVLVVSGSLLPNTLPRFDTPGSPARYRLVYDLYTRDFGYSTPQPIPLAPEAVRISNEFIIEP